MQNRPGVTPGGATNREETALHRGVGNEVVWRGAGHCHLHNVARARYLRSLRNGEMHEAVIARSSGKPFGREVLAAPALGHQHLDGGPLQVDVLCP